MPIRNSDLKNMAGLYIHIPFCESRCIYCGFYSTTSLSMRDDYVDALCKEMKMRPFKTATDYDYSLRTIYLGGGTPSQLTHDQLIHLFEGIKKAYFPPNHSEEEFSKMEITMECNPDDVSEEFCKTLLQLPVNRVSMGAQTFSDHRLGFLHRRHKAADVKAAIKRLRGIDIHNISIDLMFGFPGETLEDWKKDIDEAIKLEVEHISAYSLMYEEGTTLYRMLERGKIEEIDEEMNSFDKLMYYNSELFYMIENSVSLDLLARLYSSQLVTKSEKHLLDHNRVYYKVIRQTVIEGQKRGEIVNDVSVNEIVKTYALCERAFLYDWCICSGDYSLSKYSSRMLPMFMSSYKL